MSHSQPSPHESGPRTPQPLSPAACRSQLWGTGAGAARSSRKLPRKHSSRCGGLALPLASGSECSVSWNSTSDAARRGGQDDGSEMYVKG